jgi:uncharacterized membrane protein YvlD (DUF360 family)
MYTLVHIAVLTGVVLLASRLVAGVKVSSAPAAFGVALVFSLLNWVVGFPLKFLVGVVVFVPAILTFGLLFFAVPLIVNAILLWITDKVLGVFELQNARALWLMALFISAANFVFHRWR